jgi:carbon-monoxide dehydrogenase small subunit
MPKMTDARRLTTLNINSDRYEMAVKPSDFLVEVLRDKLGLIGTKRGCDTGKCGACTVLLDGEAVRSCLVLAVSAQGAEITTIEGLAPEGEMHPIQQAFVEHGAIQCGFCTPGLIMFTKAYLDEEPTPTRTQIQEALAANVCRCTGYVKIMDAVEDLAQSNAKGASGNNRAVQAAETRGSAQQSKLHPIRLKGTSD